VFSVHNAAPGDAVLSQGSAAQVPSPVLNQVALGPPGKFFHSWLGRIFRAAEIAQQWSPTLPNQAT